MKYLIKHHYFPFILSFLFLGNLLWGCLQLKEIKKSEIMSYEGKEHIVLVTNDQKMLLNEASLSNNQLHGAPELLVPQNRVRKIKTVEVFVSKFNEIIRHDETESISVPLEIIDKVKVRDLRVGATIVSIAIGTAALTTIIIAIANNNDSSSGSKSSGTSSGSGTGTGTGSGVGGSCPFVFTKIGDMDKFAGEIFSGSVHPRLERHDYLELHEFYPENEMYNLKLVNYFQEIQYTNLLELLVFDHPKETNVLVDKHGNHHTITNPVSAKTAINSIGESIAFELKSKDDIKFTSPISQNSNVFDPIYLSFTRPAMSNSAKLIIEGKNTTWLDNTMSEYISLFGKEYKKWNNRKLLKYEDQIKQWRFNQGIPLSVYMKINDEWQFVDYFQISGPIIDKADVIELNLPETQSNLVELKIVAGFLFWELDYIAMDFSQNSNVIKHVSSITKAYDNNDTDLSKKIKENDKYYLIQSKVGDEVNISFNAPPINPNMKRTVVLHSKGYYKVQTNTKNKPSKKFVENSRKAKHFTQFSKNKFEKIYNKTMK